MIKFIHTGDLHLGLQFKNLSLRSEKAIVRRRELWETFERIVNYSISTNKDFLFIAGDLFESEYFTLGDIKRVRDILATSKKTNVLISAGNHDYINGKSLYKKVQWSDNITIFDTNGIECKSFMDLNTNIYGFSWDRNEFRENIIFNDLPKLDKEMNNILLIHGDVSNKSNYLPLSMEALRNLGMDYIALGHIHKPNIYNKNIAYCGCPEPLDFGEIGNRGIIEGTIDQGVTNLQFMPFSKRCYHEVNMEVNENMGYLNIINKFDNIGIGNISEDYYRIKLTGYIQKDIDLNSIIKDVEEKFYHIEIINNTIPDYDLDLLEKSNEENIIGQFIKSMKTKNLEDEINKDALYYGLDVLLKDRY